MDSQGVVHLQGALSANTRTAAAGWNPTLIGTFPAGIAPSRTVYTIVQTLLGTYSDLKIMPDGEIWLLPSPNTDTGFVSLEGISYYDGAYAGSPACPTPRTDCVQPLTPDPGWADAGYGASAPGAWEDINETVHLEGAVAGAPGSPDKIASVPTSMAPYRNVFTIVHTLGGTYADLRINTDGSIWLIPSANTRDDFVSLEGITYTLQPEAPGPMGVGYQPLVLGSGWTATSCCGSTGTIDPGWYQDADEIVHLLGAVTPSGGGGEVGRLPAAARPSSNVYTIVHTTSGTYSDLKILTDGTIWLNPASGFLTYPPAAAPAATNQAFVSLEGISFPQ